MDEQLWAEQFSQDVDDLVHGDEPASSEQTPPEYQQLLAVARALAEPIDPSNQVRQRLRQRLLTNPQSQYAFQKRNAFWQHPVARVSLMLCAFVFAGMLTTAPVSAWTYTMMQGIHSLSATGIPTASQTATATPSLTMVVPTSASASLHSESAPGEEVLTAQLVAASPDAHSSAAGTPAVYSGSDAAVATLVATVVPTGSHVVLASVVP